MNWIYKWNNLPERKILKHQVENNQHEAPDCEPRKENQYI